MATAAKKTEDNDDDQFEMVTSFKQFAAAPEPKFVIEDIPELKKTNGKLPRVRLYQLTQGEYHDLLEEDKVYRNGEHVSFDRSYQNEKLLKYTMRDGENRHIWPTVEAAIAGMAGWPLHVVRRLWENSEKVNAADSVSAEKNSDETQNDSSPSS